MANRMVCCEAPDSPLRIAGCKETTDLETLGMENKLHSENRRSPENLDQTALVFDECERSWPLLGLAQSVMPASKPQ